MKAVERMVCIIIAGVLLLLSEAQVSSFAFAPPSFSWYHHTRRTTTLFSSDSSSIDDGGIEDFESERMNIVRILQRSYYRDIPDDIGNQTMMMMDEGEYAQSSKTTSFDRNTGKINNLPLWRVGWVETPGRRNCLNVHEMHCK